MTAKSGSADKAGSLRRFGLAVVRDNWHVCDERAASRLVDSLCARALLAADNDAGAAGGDERVRLYARFIRFYRRHARIAALEDGASETMAVGPYAGEAGGGGSAARAMRTLPLELRESLLLVTLEGFSHVEAAQALDIPLAALIDRLARARAMLAAGMSERAAAAAETLPRLGRPNLRLVK